VKPNRAYGKRKWVKEKKEKMTKKGTGRKGKRKCRAEEKGKKGKGR